MAVDDRDRRLEPEALVRYGDRLYEVVKYEPPKNATDGTLPAQLLIRDIVTEELKVLTAGDVVLAELFRSSPWTELLDADRLATKAAHAA